jgi:hypothetical protein
MLLSLIVRSMTRRPTRVGQPQSFRPVVEALGERLVPSIAPIATPSVELAALLSDTAPTVSTVMDTSFHAAGSLTSLTLHGNRRLGPIEGSSPEISDFMGDFFAVVKRLGNDETAKGTLTIVASNGDQLVLSFVIVRERHQDSFIGSYLVTEGTGRFADASGAGTMTLTPDANGTATFTLDGELADDSLESEAQAANGGRKYHWHPPSKGW